MAKWKPLPTEPSILTGLLNSLKDKEMKLEADLAIKDNPTLATNIQRLALATARLKKDTEGINKMQYESLDDRTRSEALVRRLQYLGNQQKNTLSNLESIIGSEKDAKKIIELFEHCKNGRDELKKAYEATKKDFEDQGLRLETLIPTTWDFLSDICK